MDTVWILLWSNAARMALLLAILAVMVRFKIRIGVVLMSAPALAAALFWSGSLPSRFLDIAARDQRLFVWDTIALLLLTAQINVFGALLKRTEKLPRFMAALRALSGDARVAMAGMPALIGFLPMPGGALLSAPMVDEAAEGVDRPVSPDDKAAVNYLFRHVWEYAFPMYPVVLAATVIWRVDFGELAMRNAVLLFAAIGGALTFALRPIGPLKGVVMPGSRFFHMRAISAGISPVIALITLWLLIKHLGPGGLCVIDWKPWDRVSLVIALLAVNAGLAMIGGVDWRWMRGQTRKSLPLEMAMLLTGAMLFQGVIEASGAVAVHDTSGVLVGGLARELESVSAPLGLVVFALPFLVGMLTGVAIAFATVAFPIIRELVLVGGSPDAGATVLAFAGGYVGVLLSPIHLCLVLTIQHFGADTGRVYRKILLPVGAICLAAVAYYLLNTGL